MTNQEVLKAILMANIKKITKESAIESILFLIALHDITLKDLDEALTLKVKKEVE